MTHATIRDMRDVGVGIVGLGNVGGGALAILADNGEEIAKKLGFRLRVVAVCSPSVAQRQLPAGMDGVVRTTQWRELVAHPDVEIVAELIGGVRTARDVVLATLDAGKSLVTANKELMALCGGEIWDRAIASKSTIAMEASVAGGIPIHNVLREGISGDRIAGIHGILNGTCNFILTEMESRGADFEDVLAEAQKLGFAEADPSTDVDGYDARSKLAILSALAFGERITPSDIYTEGIRRVQKIDFDYSKEIGCTIRLLASARRTTQGLVLSVRPALVSNSSILASVRGSYNAILVRGDFGEDTFYYGRGAGSLPTGVAVVSDLMRVAREIRSGNSLRVSPFAHERLGEYRPIPASEQTLPFYMRFRVRDQPGIIAALAGILAERQISLDAVVQLPNSSKSDLPFVITVEPTNERSIQDAASAMARLPFLNEPPLVLPMEMES